ncbi:hypothetical protein LCGC14_1456620, partial [marine sediment metagenome]
MTTVSGTFTAVGQSATLDVISLGEDITISLTGGSTATVEVQREKVPYSGSWQTIRTYFGNVEVSFRQERKNERYRFDCTVFNVGAGTVTYSISDGVNELTQITDPNTGVLLAHYDEDGFVVDGDFDVTGTLTPAGNVSIGGTLAVTGATTLTGALTATDGGGAISGTTITADVIEAGDSSLGINGEDAAQGGAILTTGGTSSTAANDGGAVSLVGGTPGSTGKGGAVNLTGGVGGSSSDTGGAVVIAGGAASAGNSAGGLTSVKGGAGAG